MKGDLKPITRREQECLELFVKDLTNKDVANLLKLSVKTVGAHRYRLYEKLGAHSVAELIALAGASPIPVYEYSHEDTPFSRILTSLKRIEAQLNELKGIETRTHVQS